MAKRPGLGGAPLKRAEAGQRRSRGLASAMRGEVAEEIIKIPLADIAHNPDNFTVRVEDVEDLVESIREVGQIQPGVVETAADWLSSHPDHEDAIAGRKYVCVVGHRRHTALSLAGVATLDAVVRSLDRADEMMLHENRGRLELTPIQEAQQYRRVMDREGLTQSVMAKHAGVTQAHVSKRLSLLSLPPRLQGAVGAGVLPANVGVTWSTKEDPEVLAEVANSFQDDVDPAVQLGEAKRVVARAKAEDVAREAAERDGVEFLDDVTSRFDFRDWEHVLQTKKDVAAARKAGELAYGPGDESGPKMYRLTLPKPAAAPPRVADAPRTSTGDAEDQAAADRQQAQAEERGRREARAARRRFLEGFVARKPPTKDVAGVLSLAMTHAAGTHGSVLRRARLLAQAAGVGPDTTEDVVWRDAVADVEAEATREHLAWVIALAGLEELADAASGWVNGAPLAVARYLRYLVKHGYDLAEWERTELDRSEYSTVISTGTEG